MTRHGTVPSRMAGGRTELDMGDVAFSVPMDAEQWQATYRDAFERYYSPEHIERLFRRAKASGIKPVRILNHVLQFYFTFVQEKGRARDGEIERRRDRETVGQRDTERHRERLYCIEWFSRGTVSESHCRPLGSKLAFHETIIMK